MEKRKVDVYLYHPESGQVIFSMNLTTGASTKKLNSNPHMTEVLAHQRVLKDHPDLEDLDLQWGYFWDGRE